MTLQLRDMAELHDAEAGTIGDCWRASIATVLGLPTDEVPHFVRVDVEANGWDDDSGAWFTTTIDWLWARELVIQPLSDRPDQPHIACGPGPRGLNHCVAVDADGTVLDPHPSRDGLLSVNQRWILVPAAEAGAA